MTASDGTNSFQAQVNVVVAFQPHNSTQYLFCLNFPGRERFDQRANKLTNGDVFLTKFPSQASDASSYYAAIDPQNKKTTLTGWLIANGFPTNPIPASTTNFMNGVVAATYGNALDLGFGRRILIMIGTNGGDWAFAVGNFHTLNDAVANTNPIRDRHDGLFLPSRLERLVSPSFMCMRFRWQNSAGCRP